MKNIAFFVSGSGSNMQAVIDAVDCGKIAAKSALVVASKPNIYAVDRAVDQGIPYIVKSEYKINGFSGADEYILSQLKAHNIDIILLAGYLSILSNQLVDAYSKRILNIHPSLIPAFCGKGFYGMHVHNAVYDAGVKVTGATVHFVDGGVDTGAIILQGIYHIKPEDTADDIQKNVLKIEHTIFPKAITALIENRIIFDEKRCYVKNTTTSDD